MFTVGNLLTNSKSIKTSPSLVKPKLSKQIGGRLKKTLIVLISHWFFYCGNTVPETRITPVFAKLIIPNYVTMVPRKICEINFPFFV